MTFQQRFVIAFLLHLVLSALFLCGQPKPLIGDTSAMSVTCRQILQFPILGALQLLGHPRDSHAATSASIGFVAINSAAISLCIAAVWTFIAIRRTMKDHLRRRT